jgi:hypothetical protein
MLTHPLISLAMLALIGAAISFGIGRRLPVWANLAGTAAWTAAWGGSIWWARHRQARLSENDRDR